MSHYLIEKLPGEPIVVGTTFDSWEPIADIPVWAEDAYNFLDTMTEPVTYVANLIPSGSWSIDELVRAASGVARGAKPILHHPKLKETLIVTEQRLVTMSALGLQSNVFGNVRVKAFTSLEEALTYARGQ